MIVGAASRSPSPSIKIEPPDELPPGRAPVVVDITGDVAAPAGRGGRGGRGVPKTCGTCKELKKGGCACVKSKATGK